MFAPFKQLSFSEPFFGSSLLFNISFSNSLSGASNTLIVPLFRVKDSPLFLLKPRKPHPPPFMSFPLPSYFRPFHPFIISVGSPPFEGELPTQELLLFIVPPPVVPLFSLPSTLSKFFTLPPSILWCWRPPRATLPVFFPLFPFPTFPFLLSPLRSFFKAEDAELPATQDVFF